MAAVTSAVVLIEPRIQMQCRSDVPQYRLKQSSQGGRLLLQKYRRLLAPFPRNCGLVCTTMISYYGIFHIPLSFGGLPIAERFLPLDVTNPLIKASLLFILQITELYGCIWLLQSSIRPYGNHSKLLRLSFTEFISMLFLESLRWL